MFTEHLLLVRGIVGGPGWAGLEEDYITWGEPGALLLNSQVSWGWWRGSLCPTHSPSASLPAPELPLPLDLPPPPPLDVDELGLLPPPPPGFEREEPSWVPATYLEKGT